jgi:hypothetical protein
LPFVRNTLALAAACMVIASVAAQRQPSRPAAAAPGGGGAPPLKNERSVPFRAGETLSYDVSWSSYFTAGTATVTIVEKKPSSNSMAYYIVAEGRPTPLLSRIYTLYYKADTLLDAYSLLPQRSSVYSEEGRRRETKVTRFDHAARRARYEQQVGGRAAASEDVSIPPGTQDVLSVLYALRTMAMKPGAKTTLPIVSNGDMYRMHAVVGNRETVRAGIGSVTAWKIVPTIVDKNGEPEGSGYGVWLTDDARRLPVLMEATLPVGSFRLILRSIRG